MNPRHAAALALGDELFSLTPPDLPCYAYGMDNRHDAPDWPHSPEIGRRPLLAKTIFDGTKLPIEPTRPKTTSNGRNCSFPPFSITQNRAHADRVGFVSRAAK
jgi:hypothetical protein